MDDLCLTVTMSDEDGIFEASDSKVLAQGRAETQIDAVTKWVEAAKHAYEILRDSKDVLSEHEKQRLSYFKEIFEG